jgi:lysophospholipase
MTQRPDAKAEQHRMRAAPSTGRRAIPPHAHESIWRAPDGFAIRRIDWSGRHRDGACPRGSLLFMPGRADFYEKYLEALDFWHDKGWRVTALDWRWQAGSGRYHRDPKVGGTASFDFWIRDLRDFWGSWSAATPGPHVLVGHSMGGHLVLRAVAERKIRPNALVLSAPMLGFVTPVPERLQPGFARAMCRIGESARPAWKSGERPGDSAAKRGLALTHDPLRYADEIWWRLTRPELDLGPASWDWVRKASESMQALAAPGLIETIDIPVLTLGARHDSLVSWPAIKRMAARLPRGELVEFGRDAAHELLREADPVRDHILAQIDCFLDRVAPARAP